MLVNQTELAEMFGKTSNTIINWRKSGMPSVREGKRLLYRVPDVIEWYTERENPNGELKKEEALRRKIVAEMSKSEIEASIAKGELMKTEDFIKQIGGKVTAARNSLLTLKSTLMPMFRQYAGENAQILANALDEEMRRVLQDISEKG